MDDIIYTSDDVRLVLVMGKMECIILIGMMVVGIVIHIHVSPCNTAKHVAVDGLLNNDIVMVVDVALTSVMLTMGDKNNDDNVELSS